jgi:hypothetical protein
VSNSKPHCQITSLLTRDSITLCDAQKIIGEMILGLKKAKGTAAAAEELKKLREALTTIRVSLEAQIEAIDEMENDGAKD